MSHDVESDRTEVGASLYESAYYFWMRQHADLLRSGRLQTHDGENILEKSKSWVVASAPR